MLCVLSAIVVERQGKLSVESAWLVLGLPASDDTERAFDRLSHGMASTVTTQAVDTPSSMSRPASPDAAQDTLVGSRATSGSEAAAEPTVLSRQSSSAQMLEAADSQFTELLVLTGCTVVRTCLIHIVRLLLNSGRDSRQ